MCMAPLARGRMLGRSDLAKMAEETAATDASSNAVAICCAILQEYLGCPLLRPLRVWNRTQNISKLIELVIELVGWSQLFYATHFPQHFFVLEEMGRTEAELAIRWSLQQGQLVGREFLLNFSFRGWCCVVPTVSYQACDVAWEQR